ncbi:MAG: outer membrane beta-barrel protein [Candidatus Zixiibacteriota bacterium]
MSSGQKAVLMVGPILFLLILVSSASAARFGIGGFAGINIPLAQEDVKSGILYGAKGRIPLLPVLGVEPNFVFSKYGDKDIDNVGTREGGTITSFGADLILGNPIGFSRGRFYVLLGINANTLKREGLSDQTQFGLSFGPGFEFLPTEVLGIEVRARLHGISLEGGGGRNNLELSGGLNYYFGQD